MSIPYVIWIRYSDVKYVCMCMIGMLGVLDVTLT